MLEIFNLIKLTLVYAFFSSGLINVTVFLFGAYHL